MDCEKHPGQKTVSKCLECGEGICTVCVSETGDVLRCPECYQKDVARLAAMIGGGEAKSSKAPREPKVKERKERKKRKAEAEEQATVEEFLPSEGVVPVAPPALEAPPAPPQAPPVAAPQPPPSLESYVESQTYPGEEAPAPVAPLTPSPIEGPPPP